MNDQKHEEKLRSFTIHLQPDNAHNGRKITFKDHAVPSRDQVVSMARWEASVGSSNAKSGMPIFKLPDGSLTHYYCKSDLQPGKHPGHPHRFPGPLVLSNHFPGVHPEVDFPILRGALQPLSLSTRPILIDIDFPQKKRANKMRENKYSIC